MKILRLFIVSVIFFASSVSYAQNASRDSVMLSYRPSSYVLLVDYKNNKQQLDDIFSFVKKNVSNLQNNKAHINIVSYIKPNQVGDPLAINTASVQASVVRAEFKTKFNIPHTAITFYIDTTQNINNQVRVDFVALPVPAYSNNAIYYTESSSMSAINSQIAKYKPEVPYTNYWMRLAKMNPEMFGFSSVGFNKGESIPAIALIPAKNQPEVNIEFEDEVEVIGEDIDNLISSITETDSLSNVSSIVGGVVVESEAAYNNVVPQKVTDTIIHTEIKYLTKRENPIFGLKTNLLFWVAAMPNLEMEFYIGNRVSLDFEGSYTWGWFLPQDRAYYAWNAGGEVRFWFNDDGKFNGHFLGVHGGAGQYDFKFSQYGYQGDFYYTGIAYGYMLPIKGKFHMEFSIGAGWARYSELCYENIAGTNFTVNNQPSKDYFGITKAKISCVWKF